MFVTRLISGIVLLILAILSIHAGGPLLLGLSLLISLVGLYELFRALDIQKKLVTGIQYVFTILFYISLGFPPGMHIFYICILDLMCLQAMYVLTFPGYTTRDIAYAFFGFAYVPLLFSFLFQTRMLQDGQILAWLILISSWGSDTCAYAVGVCIGKHKIAPVLSPKKSVEGCIGGVLGAALIGGLMGWFLREHLNTSFDPALTCALACGIGSVISQIGDAVASAIKRNHDIKDYGTLIPGHGGMLDRFDSMIFTAPAVFLALKLLGQ